MSILNKLEGWIIKKLTDRSIKRILNSFKQ